MTANEYTVAMSGLRYNRTVLLCCAFSPRASRQASCTKSGQLGFGSWRVAALCWLSVGVSLMQEPIPSHSPFLGGSSDGAERVRTAGELGPALQSIKKRPPW